MLPGSHLGDMRPNASIRGILLLSSLNYRELPPPIRGRLRGHSRGNGERAGFRQGVSTMVVNRRHSVRNIAVTLDGVTHIGTFYVQGPMVHVQCDAGTKATQRGGSPAAAIAKLLLFEMVRGAGAQAKPKK